MEIGIYFIVGSAILAVVAVIFWRPRQEVSPRADMIRATFDYIGVEHRHYPGGVVTDKYNIVIPGLSLDR